MLEGVQSSACSAIFSVADEGADKTELQIYRKTSRSKTIPRKKLRLMQSWQLRINQKIYLKKLRFIQN